MRGDAWKVCVFRSGGFQRIPITAVETAGHCAASVDVLTAERRLLTEQAGPSLLEEALMVILERTCICGAWSPLVLLNCGHQGNAQGGLHLLPPAFQFASRAPPTGQKRKHLAKEENVTFPGFYCSITKPQSKQRTGVSEAVGYSLMMILCTHLYASDVGGPQGSFLGLCFPTVCSHGISATLRLSVSLS